MTVPNGTRSLPLPAKPLAQPDVGPPASGAGVVVHLHRSDAEAITRTVVELASDRRRSPDERAAWLAVGMQLLRQIEEHR
ncbi:MAG: hypothetical protein M0Z46_06430 [Actinomycetota bacterium]|jgi:hypothetical protein|nr:hypothetical protein [Actinomycetota bacterium]